MKDEPAGVAESDAMMPGGLRQKKKILQEIVIHADGTVEVPWIQPAATSLVLEVWDAIGRRKFPVGVWPGARIYCG